MKPHESPRINKKSFVAIRAIRGLCGIGVLLIKILHIDRNLLLLAHQKLNVIIPFFDVSSQF